MNWYKDNLQVPTRGKGLYPFTNLVTARLQNWKIEEGMCFLYLPHTSASLLINESYDPSAREDLQTFMEKIAPEGLAWYEHTLEGADDSPSHIRAMLTPSSLAIPIDDGKLSLGTWQGVYLFEHREEGSRRTVLLRCLSVT